MTALPAGAIHLAQVGVHLEAGWIFAGFFAVVGSVQVIAALLLVRPRPAGWFLSGIVGCVVVIATWVMSRTVGLPFGPEPGGAEALGTADTAASLTEAVTVVALGLWLADGSAKRRRIGSATGLLIVAGLGVAWVATRAAGLFDPDPRATLALPQLADRAVVGLVAGVVVMLGLLTAYPSARPHWWPSLMRGMLAALLVVSGAVVGLTLPAARGQNAACAYAPLAEVGLASHDEVRASPLEAGEERWFGAVVLVACGEDAVELEGAEVLNARGQADVLAFVLLPANTQLAEEGTPTLPTDSRSLDSGPMLEPGDRRQVAVLLRGSAERFNIDSLRIAYSAGGLRGSVAFATALGTCPPSTCAGDASPN